MPNTIAWSWSRLNDFETCPKKFQGKYVTKEFPKPNFDAPHLRRGKAIHKALEDYMESGVLITNPIIYKTKNHAPEAFHVDLHFLMPLLNAMHQAPIKVIEKNLCFDINLKPRTWWSKKAWCRIIMDCLVVVNDFALVIDWKSGKVQQFSDQLKLSAGAVLELYPQVNRVLTAYVWCEHPHDKPTYAEYTRLDHKDIWMEFGDRSELIQMANESGHWPAKKNIFCPWCEAAPSQCEFKPEDD